MTYLISRYLEKICPKYKLLLCWARSILRDCPFKSYPLWKEDVSALSDDQLRQQLAILHWME
jgi:hypothetical protein